MRIETARQRDKILTFGDIHVVGPFPSLLLHSINFSCDAGDVAMLDLRYYMPSPSTPEYNAVLAALGDREFRLRHFLQEFTVQDGFGSPAMLTMRCRVKHTSWVAQPRPRLMRCVKLKRH